MSHIVDIVFCIDCTGSMSPVIDSTKEFALGFQDVLKDKLSEQQKSIDELRVKAIGFRDIFVDGDASFMESRFFSLPDEAEQYKSFVEPFKADGGGDEPESGLEAFSLAMNSDWNTAEGRKRQIICILTDASAHSLEKGASSRPEGYPEGIVQSFDELAEKWELEMDNKARRLVVFAPDVSPWTEICPEDQGGFDAAIHYPSKAGAGLSDVDYGSIVELIANSI